MKAAESLNTERKKAKKRRFSNGKRICAAELEGEVCASRQSIKRWYEAGKFPEPHFIGQRRYWFRTEIEEWLEEQANAA
ncbi:MAG: hypothetical protein RPU90_05115 [Candidatus Sedimenticola sp. (ex Thyasira tokunagai)]